MDAMLIPSFLCPKAWEDMSGNETTRFCTYCKKHVHNLETMSVSERLTLLSSPAASICSRYKVALRRPAPGNEESYLRHMAKYGAGVALTGSVLLVLWEMHEQGNRSVYYRAAGMYRGATGEGCSWPPDLYEERETVLLGAIASPEDYLPEPRSTEGDIAPVRHVDLNLDASAIERLWPEIKPRTPELKPKVPLNLQ